MTEQALDANLVKIVSYLTFDGHLAQDLKCFYLSSKDKSMLLDFEEAVFQKFKIKGKLEKGTGYGESYKYRVFNREICKFLERIGAPKGNKTLKSFSVPDWVIKDKEFCREYLRVAFDCEGGIWLEDKPKIRFGMWKSEELIDNSLAFIEQIKAMLEQFDVKCTKTWLTKSNSQVIKKGATTKGLYFQIKRESLQAFSKEVGFSNTFKKQRLSSI
jgi:intein/homing endonuclease